MKGAEITSLMRKGTCREVEGGDRYRPSSLEICSLLGLERILYLYPRVKDQIFLGVVQCYYSRFTEYFNMLFSEF